MNSGQNITFREICRISTPGVKSLVWEGNLLVDWVAGGARFGLDGSVRPRHVNYAYRFDAACTSPSGEYAIIYQRTGTKALVLRRGKILREINRSFHHANAYEYPLTITRLSSGREVLIHCPDAYNRIEIDDVATGERLTISDKRTPSDFFHSRLAADAAATYLMSAGWIWHPFGAVLVFPFEEALKDPRVLDGWGLVRERTTEIGSAAFSGNAHLIVWGTEETFGDEEDFADTGVLRSNSIARVALPEGRIEIQRRVSERIGTLTALGSDYAIGFYGHPKAIRLATGAVVARLPDLNTGAQISSIIWSAQYPPLAIDSAGSRFAVADQTCITVVEIGIVDAASRANGLPQ